MSGRKVEGTYILDGMLEGYLREQQDEHCVKRFLQQVKERGLKFHMVSEGERFTLLPDKKSNKLAGGVDSVASLLRHPLENLLSSFEAEDATSFISTLRSIEYAPGTEKQALYCIGPDGGLMIEQRSVPTETVAPAGELSLQEKLKLAAVAGVIIVVLFAISAIFVPYGKLTRNLYHSLKPYDLEGLTIKTESFEDYFTVEKVERRMSDGKLIIICQRKPEFPATRQQFNREWLEHRDDLYASSAVQALARGQLLCKFYDGENRLIGQTFCPMLAVEDGPQRFALTVPFDKAIAQIKLSF